MGDDRSICCPKCGGWMEPTDETSWNITWICDTCEYRSPKEDDEETKEEV